MSGPPHPVNLARQDLGLAPLDLPFPPKGWRILQDWGNNGYTLMRIDSGLRAIIDCSRKEDDRFWVHVSISYRNRIPNQRELVAAKQDFIGDRYAYAVYPPFGSYVNVHRFCLHLWALADGDDGRVLPEFSGAVRELGLAKCI